MNKSTLIRKRTKPENGNTPLEFFQITTEALTPTEIKDSRQEPTDEDNDLLERLMISLRTNPETIRSEDCEYFRELEKLRLKYPRNPVVMNYLTLGYYHLDQIEKANSLLFETCEKFPDYLFARTAVAKMLLKEGKPTEAIAAIGNALTIKQLYPHRDVFHASEVKVFEDVLVTYFYYMEDLEQAEHHLKIIEKIALEMLENPNDSVLVGARQLLQYGKTYLGLRKRKNKRK